MFHNHVRRSSNMVYLGCAFLYIMHICKKENNVFYVSNIPFGGKGREKKARRGRGWNGCTQFHDIWRWNVIPHYASPLSMPLLPYHKYCWIWRGGAPLPSPKLQIEFTYLLQLCNNGREERNKLERNLK